MEKMKKMKTTQVYLDNGSTTKTDPEVVKAMLPYFTETYGNASSIHSFGTKAKQALEHARKTIAKAINADPEEIIFTSGGTESDNIAIKGGAYANEHKGNHIITSKVEHPAVLNTCKTLEKFGMKVTYLDVDKDGFINLDQLKKSITKKTILVTIIHGNNEVGTINNLYEIGKICKEHKILLHTDAVQSFTKVPIDVKKTNIDLISFSSHKIHGPKGVGSLYIRKGTNIWGIQDGGHHEFDKRPGTENISGIIGFARAVELMKNKDIDHMAKLRDYMIEEMLKIQDTKLNGPKKNRLCNNVNISFKYIEGEGILLHLDSKGIAVSTGSACTSQSLEPSHVLSAMGIPPEMSHGSIRFTLSKFTTKQEVDYAVKSIREAISKLRAMSPFYREKREE